MNPTPLSRIQTFRKQALLPALADIEDLFGNVEQQVIIAHNAEIGDDAVNVMLQQMHSGKPYLNSIASNTLDLQASSTIPRNWVGDSVYVEILQTSDVDLIRVSQYCLSIEFRIFSPEHIQVWFIISHTKAENKTLQIYQHLFEENLDPASLERIESADIILSFVESYEAFEAHISEPEIVDFLHE
jgi:hypothetical protein